MANKTTAFDKIQIELLKMDLDSMIGLFNDCSKILGVLRKEIPEVRKETDLIVKQTICQPNKDVMSLMGVIFETYDIDKSNFMVRAIQNGGAGGDDGDGEAVQLIESTRQSTNGMTTSEQSNDTRIIPYQQLGNPLIMSALQNADKLTPDAQIRVLEIIAGQVNTASIIALQESNERAARERFSQIRNYSTIIVPVSAPGFIIYYLQSIAQNAALKIISDVGGMLGKVVGLGDRAVTNGIIGSIAKGASVIAELPMLKHIVPGQAKAMLDTVGEGVAGNAELMVTSATQGLVDVTKDSIHLANVLIYIMCSILLYLVLVTITTIQSDGIEIVGLGFGFRLGGRIRKKNGGKKTRKLRKVRKIRKRQTKRRY